MSTKTTEQGKPSFFTSRAGQRFFNFAYSWGAAVVIIGAMFKILHMPFGNTVLMVGMIVEALVFFFSAFDFSSTKSNTVTPGSGVGIGGAENGNGNSSRTNANVSTGSGTMPVQGGYQGGGYATGGSSVGGGNAAYSNSSNYFSPEYSEKMSDAAKSLEDFAKVMTSLNEVSASLLTSYKQIADSTQGASESNTSFASNIRNLNSNISGLNEVYEAQLQSISNQIATVKYINESLERIKTLYDGTIADSSVFREETEKMTKQIEALNKVYARLLQAMTSNNNPNII